MAATPSRSEPATRAATGSIPGQLHVGRGHDRAGHGDRYGAAGVDHRHLGVLLVPFDRSRLVLPVQPGRRQLRPCARVRPPTAASPMAATASPSRPPTRRATPTQPLRLPPGSWTRWRPPAPSITSNPSNPTNQTSASFGFSDTEGGVSFQCRLDAGGFVSCTSPQSYPGPLAEGSHTFTVVATDAAGNTSLPASYTWSIDSTAARHGH